MKFELKPGVYIYLIFMFESLRLKQTELSFLLCWLQTLKDCLRRLKLNKVLRLF